jgi:hypothetical protein
VHSIWEMRIRQQGWPGIEAADTVDKGDEISHELVANVENMTGTRPSRTYICLDLMRAKGDGPCSSCILGEWRMLSNTAPKYQVYCFFDVNRWTDQIVYNETV